MRIPLALAVALAATPATATTGWGCYHVNVGDEDPLAVRAGPSADGRPLASLTATMGSIVALDAPSLRGEGRQPDLFEVNQAEYAVCEPRNLPLGARWCPVTVFSEQTVSGWVKRRFLDHSECP